jgi:acyl carrier protein
MADLTLEDRGRIKKIVCEAVDLQPGQLSETADLADHGVGSVQALEIITILEDELDISISMSELARIKNLEDVYEVVASAEGS